MMTDNWLWLAPFSSSLVPFCSFVCLFFPRFFQYNQTMEKTISQLSSLLVCIN